MWWKSTASCSPLSRIQQSNKKREAGLPMRPSANVLMAWNALTHPLSREWAKRTLNAVAHASAAPSRSVSCGIHFQPANVRVYAYVWVCCVLVRSLNILFRLFQTSVCVRSCCLVDAQYLLLALRSCIVNFTFVPIHRKPIESYFQFYLCLSKQFSFNEHTTSG